MSMEKGIRYNVETGESEKYEFDVSDTVRAKEQRVLEIQNRMREIVVTLEEGDYKNNKRQEGDLSDEEWKIHVDSRKNLRAEYNTIQKELATLTDTII